jgi:hypothetical protein
MDKALVKHKKKPHSSKAVRYDIKHPLIQALITFCKSHIKEKKLTGTIHSLGKFIPFLPTEWRDGTQVPTIRVYYVGDDIVSTGGSDILSVSDVSAQEFSGMVELLQVFSEYRPVCGELKYTPQVNVSLRNASGIDYHAVVVGGVDYHNGNPYGSRSDALANDTSKQFHGNHEKSWKFEFDFAPDQAWEPATSQTTDFAYLKFYSDSTLGCQASQTFGHIWGWMDFQFRLA